MVAPNDAVSITRSTAGPSKSASGAAPIFAVIATAAAGDVATPVLARSDGDPTTLYTGGELVLGAEMISKYSRQATIPVRAASAVAGSYGSLSADALVGGEIDDDGFVGTCVPAADATYVPYLDAEVYVIFDSGGTLGDAAEGITYLVSKDGGRGFGSRTALGSSTSITIDGVHAKILLTPPASQVTALVTHVNAVRTAALAHFPYTTSSVHGAADTTSDDGVGSAATNTATAITLEQQLLAALGLHLARGSTVHLVTQSAESITAALADATAAVAAAVASGTAQDAIVASIALELALEAHEASTTAHTAADAVNVVSATRPTQGTVAKNDVIQVPTYGPTLDASGLEACFDALASYNGSLFGGVVIGGSFDPDELWATLIAGLDNLRGGQVPVFALVEARPKADGETDSQYRLNLEAEWAAYHDERVFVCPARGRLDPATLDRAEAQYKRSHLWPLAARLAALDYGESPGVPKPTARDRSAPSRFGGRLDGFMVYDADGNLVGHDERLNPGLADAGFVVTTSYRRVADPTAAYIFQPKGRAASNNRAPHIAHQRVANVVEGIIYEVLTEEIESGLLYEQGRDTIRGDVADGLDAQLINTVLDQVGDPSKSSTARISELIVETDREATIDPSDPNVPVSVELRTRFYVSRFTVNEQINKEA